MHPTSLLRALLMAALLLVGLAAPSQAQSECRANTYVVKAGDSLASIAEKCGIPYAGLVGINVEISNPDLIRPGQIIRLVASVPLYADPVEGPAQVAGLQDDGTYIVRPGDSLARIAFLYDTSVVELLEANPNVPDSGLIYPGQRLIMPAGARRSKGWVGVSTLIAAPRQTVELRLVDFPPNAPVEINTCMVYLDEIFVYETRQATTDSLGNLRINITLPFYAWYGEEWAFEVVTTEQDQTTRLLSPVILID